MIKNSHELFDQECLELLDIQIRNQLKSDKCLKEREEFWQTICGFVVAHVEWFEKLKKDLMLKR